MRDLKIYGVFAAVFLAIDAIWLTLVAVPEFKAALGGMLRPAPQVLPAVLFYVIYPIGVVALAVKPAVQEGRAMGALWRAALFGLCAYATFDLTNMSVLIGWTWRLALMDMAWGTFATTIAALAGFAVARRAASATG